VRMERKSLRPQLPGLIVQGVGSIMVAQGAMLAFGFVTSIAVAHFLSPRSVGLATEAIVFVALALVLVDFGLGAAVVQRPSLSEDDESTIFWAGLALGIALTLAGIGLSWPIAALYHEPRVQGLFAVASLTFVITALGIVPGSLLHRELRFRTLQIRTIVASAVSCTIAIVMAVLGSGPWAIVVQALVMASVSTVLIWRSTTFRPRAAFSWASLRSVGGFSLDSLGTRMLIWGNINADNFLVGRFLGAANLGAYSIGYSVAVAPLNRIAAPVTEVFFSAFSRMGDRERIGQVWLRATRMIGLVIVPVMAGLLVVAPDFVQVVFGPRWRAAAPVLRLLAPIGLMQALTEANFAVLQALAYTRLQVRFTAVQSVVTICAFAAGLPWGIRGVATAYLVVSLGLQPFYVVLTTRAVGISPRAWLNTLRGVVEAGAVMLACIATARAEMITIGVPPAARLAVLIALGGIVYAAAVAWRAPEVQSELARVRTARRGDDVRADGGETPVSDGGPLGREAHARL
jgi:O-antigen/teichoic acid export membrane protein